MNVNPNPQPAASRLLSPALFKRIRQIEIRTNREVTDVLGGQYHSVFKGRGMEFEEVREYLPGDEVRSIDWNVTARFGHPFVKKFKEERELTVMLVVDVSASGQFGSRRQTKNELAAELAAVLAFSAIRNNDKVGLIMFTDQIERYVAPKKGRRHVLRVVREILAYQPVGRGTNLTLALDYLNRVQSRRAVTFVVSDFQVGDEDAVRRKLRVASKRHDVIALSLRDPREDEFPAVGLVELRDAETGERALVDTFDRNVRNEYAAKARQRLEALRRLLRRAGVDQVEIRCEADYLLPLIKFFRMRERRI
ncbi:MAG TPA: DUF58 domain-containing protein [Verrucomicrobiae bacterium]|nr:DUF58 domain-containing protein [Verrucomicrobiae bacterium]